MSDANNAGFAQSSHFINGNWVAGSGPLFAAVNPADG